MNALSAVENTATVTITEQPTSPTAVAGQRSPDRTTNTAMWNVWGRRLAAGMLLCALLVVLGRPPAAQAEMGQMHPIGYQTYPTESIAWGDWDGDGDLDLAMGNNCDDYYGDCSPNLVWENEGGTLKLDPANGSGWQAPANYYTRSVAWGDWDGDGDLDLAAGNGCDVKGVNCQPNQVWENDGGTLKLDPANGFGWQAPITYHTRSVAWGDWDSDGDLDLAVGNSGSPNQVWENDSGTLELGGGLGWQASITSTTTSVAWGDWDGDSDLDLAVGNSGSPNQVWENDSGTLELGSGLGWQAPITSTTTSVAWGDWDGDGDLDLATGNYNQPNQVWENDGGTLQLDPANSFGWQAPASYWTYSLAWGDWDGDNDLDLAVGNRCDENDRTCHPNQVWENEGGTLQLEPANGFGWQAPKGYNTSSVAWGDIDGDSNLDLAAGNKCEIIIGVESCWLSQVWDNGGGTFNFDPPNGAGWEAPAVYYTFNMAWGDWDNDGDLDLAMENQCDPYNVDCRPNQVWENEGGTLQLEPANGFGWQAPASYGTRSIAWGDWDDDGDLDLAVGNYDQPNQVWENISGTLVLSPTIGLGWQAPASYETNSVAWGDWDGDGDLDLATGDSWTSHVWENDGGTLKLDPVNGFGWQSPDWTFLTSVAWGNWDGDGDLDLAANSNGIIQVWENDSGTLKLDPANGFGWQSPTMYNTGSVAWGDWDNDGDLDLAAGNWEQPNQVWENDGGALKLDPLNGFGWQGHARQYTWNVTWGDWDNDGDLDLAAGCQVWENEGGTLNLDPQNGLGWQASDSDYAYYTRGVAWGDWDNDGDLDLATGNWVEPSRVWENPLYGGALLPDSPPTLAIQHPDPGRRADFYASPHTLSDPVIPVTYTLSDPDSNPVGHLGVFYSLDGSGGDWQPALPTTDTLTTNLATAPGGVTHVFKWDTLRSQFFGQSDNVALRFVLYPQMAGGGTSNVYQYTNLAPGPFQRPYISATTFPFRARGTQVRVVDEASDPQSGAIVYRIPSQQTSGSPIADSLGNPYHTDLNGYLIGHGTLGLGDQLVAMLPISSTEHYTLYYTSAIPNKYGLDTHVIQASGVQTLTVSAAHPLLVFNLDVSLEWDARSDNDFIAALPAAIQKASAILYDVSDGQAAIGQVRIFQNRENWTASDIVVYAHSAIRPRASMGGVVDDLTDDVISATLTISNAYGPGQVHIGPSWDTYGASTAELTLDWQKALAHELSHYLFYLPDNYLGVKNGHPTNIDCHGSFMTNTYDAAYSELLTGDPNEWQGECLDSVAEYTTGRADWETVQHFYPDLWQPTTPITGPASLPLDVTQMTIISPSETGNPLSTRIFDVRLAATQGLLSLPRAQGFLFKPGADSDNITDDVLLPLGTTVGKDDDVLKVRGAATGDRLCLFSPPVSAATPTTSISYSGCRESLLDSHASLLVEPLAGWNPDIAATAVTSTTLQITVTLPVSEAALRVQYFPTYALPGYTYSAPWVELSMIDTTASPVVYTATLALSSPSFEGWLRVWAPDNDPPKESLSQLFLSPPWGPNSSTCDCGANRRTMGANFRQLGAPVASGDGQVTIFNLQDIFAETGALSLQALNAAPNLPAWLTQIGQAYRFSARHNFPRAITFDYLQRETLPGYEHTLTIYFSPDEGQTWLRLNTELAQNINQATAEMPSSPNQGQGIYVLAATLQMPALQQGWNLFSYPLAGTRPVTSTLASIDGFYTSVYENSGVTWKLFDAPLLVEHPEFDALVNDLHTFQFGYSYWLYATQPITPYLGLSAPLSRLERGARSEGGFDPPATYYGWVEPWEALLPAPGAPVEAWIDSKLCGTGSLVEWDGQLAYKLQVASSALQEGCGQAGRQVLFRISGYPLWQTSTLWSNIQAWFLTLEPSPNTVYLPLMIWR